MTLQLQSDYTLDKIEGPMDTIRRTVSASAIQQEWLEIQAAQQNLVLFRPLYDRYFEPIIQFIYKRTLDEGISSDLSSQVFLKAMQGLGTYSFKGVPFSAWLFRIAQNEVTQFYRMSKKIRVVSIQDANLNDMESEMDMDKLESFREAVLPALEELKERDLEIIELRFFEQRPFQEIADLLGITEGNAKVRTYRVLERLKKIILEKKPDE